jgi:hypothetical protein
MNMDPVYFWRNFWTEAAHLSEGAPNWIKAIDVMREDAKKSVHTQIKDLRDFTAQLTAIKNHLFEEYPAKNILPISVREGKE